MRSFYIKKLQKQELGSPKPDGSVSRGRYFYISQAYENFFPQLSKTVKNDSVIIPIIPPFNSTKIYSTFVYHNDKYNMENGTRNEFRLYLNIDLDPDKSYFRIDDIVVFERIETSTPIPLYFLYKFSPKDEYYKELTVKIKTSQIKGAHALIVGEELNFIPQREINTDETLVIIPEDVVKVVVAKQEGILSNEEQDIEEVRGASLFNADLFRDFVLKAYNYRCAITGKAINYKNFFNLEAAHIQPKAQEGTFLPCNGIALSRDMHWAFDKGLITIDDNFKVVVHPEMQKSILMDYSDQKIFSPVEPYFQPEKKFLKHHRENIFGLFLHSGSIRKN